MNGNPERSAIAYLSQAVSDRRTASGATGVWIPGLVPAWFRSFSPAGDAGRIFLCLCPNRVVDVNGLVFFPARILVGGAVFPRQV
jgi:hypothetical protein